VRWEERRRSVTGEEEEEREERKRREKNERKERKKRKGRDGKKREKVLTIKAILRFLSWCQDLGLTFIGIRLDQ